jgi:hypothetical protein
LLDRQPSLKTIEKPNKIQFAGIGFPELVEREAAFFTTAAAQERKFNLRQEKRETPLLCFLCADVGAATFKSRE